MHFISNEKVFLCCSERILNVIPFLKKYQEPFSACPHFHLLVYTIYIKLKILLLVGLCKLLLFQIEIIIDFARYIFKKVVCMLISMEMESLIMFRCTNFLDISIFTLALGHCSWFLNYCNVRSSILNSLGILLFMFRYSVFLIAWGSGYSLILCTACLDE